MLHSLAFEGSHAACEAISSVPAVEIHEGVGRRLSGSFTQILASEHWVTLCKFTLLAAWSNESNPHMARIMGRIQAVRALEGLN